MDAKRGGALGAGGYGEREEEGEVEMSDDGTWQIFAFATVTGWLLLKFVIDPLIDRGERREEAKRRVRLDNHKYEDAAEIEYESWEK